MPEVRTQYSSGSAAANGLVACRTCQTLLDASNTRCTHCGVRLQVRHNYSIQHTLALLFAAMIFYIPANIYPILETQFLGSVSASTIMGGVWVFILDGSYFVAFVIFFASILIPLAKMMAILWLCYRVGYTKNIKQHELTRLYHITEWIGKWSMIDVFVVAILVALVQLKGLISFEPGIAANSFATVVILTMLSALSFDSRLIWDKGKFNE